MSGPDSREFDALLAFAHELADRAAEATLPHFRSRGAVDDKSGGGFFDPVTEADRAAEQVIRALVAEAWPAHALVGEEFGRLSNVAGGEPDYCWIIDPIDGTRSFITGVPLWGTLIGLCYRGTPILGLMSQPFTGERFWSGRDQAHYSGPDGERRLRTRPCTELAHATLMATGPELFSDPADLERFEAVSARVRLRRFGGDCYSYCMLASGHADLVVEASMASYDIAPLIPIVERAGGLVTTWEGEPAANGGRVLACGDPALHDVALRVLSDAV